MLGDRIKKARKIRGLTQKRLAEELGLSLTAIQYYESGKRTPNNAVVLAIAKVLDVNPHWLLTGEGEMFVEKQEGRDELLDKFMQELERIRRDYGEEHYRRMLKMALDLAESIRSISESSTKKKAG